MMLSKVEVRSNKPRDGRHCDLCGCSQPAVRCDKCGCQIFCLSCDDMYHRHPKRRFHLRKAVDTTPPTSQARPVLPMKVAHLSTSPGDPSKMPLPPPRKKKPGKSFFDTFRKGSPSSDNSPPLPKKEYSWTNRLGSIKKFMSNRPLPALPDNNNTDGIHMDSEDQPQRHDLSFIHKRVDEKPPQLPERNYKPQELTCASNGNESHLRQFSGQNGEETRNGTFNMMQMNRNGGINSTANGHWSHRTIDNQHQLNTLDRQNNPGFMQHGGPGYPLGLSQTMHQSASATDLQNLPGMDGLSGPGMPPHYPHYPMNAPLPPHYPYPMYPQYPNYPPYFGNSFANISSHTTTDGDFSDHSEASSRHQLGKRYPFRKRAKRSQSVMVDRMGYPGQYYPFGPYPPGYAPPPWGGQFPMESPPSPSGSVRSLNRMGRTRRRKKTTSEEEDEEFSVSSSPLSRPKSSSSERPTQGLRKAPLATQPTSSDESDGDENEGRRNRGSRISSRNSDTRHIPSPASKSPQVVKKKTSKLKKREIRHHSDAEEIEPNQNQNEKPQLKESSEDQKDQLEATSNTATSPTWQCNHCTYINPSSNRICQVCCKTATFIEETSLVSSRPTSADSIKQSLSSEKSSFSPEKKINEEEEEDVDTKQNKQDMENLNTALDEAEKEISRGLEELMKLKEDFSTQQQNPQKKETLSPKKPPLGKENSDKSKPAYRSTGKMRTSILDKLEFSVSKPTTKSTSTSMETQTGSILNATNGAVSRIIEARRGSTSSTTSDAYNSPEAQSPELGPAANEQNIPKKYGSQRDSSCQTQQDDLTEYLERKKFEEDTYFGRPSNGYGYRYGDRMEVVTSPVPSNYDRGFRGGFGMMPRSHSRASLFTGRINDLGPMDYGFGPSPMYRSVSRSSLTGDYPENRLSEFHNLRKPDYYLSMEELVERRRQETIKAQGLELVRMIREAEQQGFSADDIQVALSKCGKQNPVEWLHENWRNMVESVINLTTNYGNDKKENDIGGISENEAREALRMHKGNVWAAVTECVESRQRKFFGLNSRGRFSSKAITEALTAAQGDVEIAYAKLSKSSSKPFLMRIWGAGEGAQNQDGAEMPVVRKHFKSDEDLHKNHVDYEYDIQSDELWSEDEDVEWEEDAEEEEEHDPEGDLDDLQTCHDDIVTEMITPESDKSDYCDAFGTNSLDRFASLPSDEELLTIPDPKRDKKRTGLLSKLAALKNSEKQGSYKFYDEETAEDKPIIIQDNDRESNSRSDEGKSYTPFNIIKNTISAIRDTVSGSSKSEKKLPCASPERRTIVVREKLPQELIDKQESSNPIVKLNISSNSDSLRENEEMEQSTKLRDIKVEVSLPSIVHKSSVKNNATNKVPAEEVQKSAKPNLLSLAECKPPDIKSDDNGKQHEIIQSKDNVKIPIKTRVIQTDRLEHIKQDTNFEEDNSYGEKAEEDDEEKIQTFSKKSGIAGKEFLTADSVTDVNTMQIDTKSTITFVQIDDSQTCSAYNDSKDCNKLENDSNFHENQRPTNLSKGNIKETKEDLKISNNISESESKIIQLKARILDLKNSMAICAEQVKNEQDRSAKLTSSESAKTLDLHEQIKALEYIDYSSKEEDFKVLGNNSTKNIKEACYKVDDLSDETSEIQLLSENEKDIKILENNSKKDFEEACNKAEDFNAMSVILSNSIKDKDNNPPLLFAAPANAKENGHLNRNAPAKATDLKNTINFNGDRSESVNHKETLDIHASLEENHTTKKESQKFPDISHADGLIKIKKKTNVSEKLNVENIVNILEKESIKPLSSNDHDNYKAENSGEKIQTNEKNLVSSTPDVNEVAHVLECEISKYQQTKKSQSAGNSLYESRMTSSNNLVYSPPAVKDVAHVHESEISKDQQTSNSLYAENSLNESRNISSNNLVSSPSDVKDVAHFHESEISKDQQTSNSQSAENSFNESRNISSNNLVSSASAVKDVAHVHESEISIDQQTSNSQFAENSLNKSRSISIRNLESSPSAAKDVEHNHKSEISKDQQTSNIQSAKISLNEGRNKKVLKSKINAITEGHSPGNKLAISENEVSNSHVSDNDPREIPYVVHNGRKPSESEIVQSEKWKLNDDGKELSLLTENLDVQLTNINSSEFTPNSSDAAILDSSKLELHLKIADRTSNDHSIVNSTSAIKIFSINADTSSGIESRGSTINNTQDSQSTDSKKETASICPSESVISDIKSKEIIPIQSVFIDVENVVSKIKEISSIDPDDSLMKYVQQGNSSENRTSFISVTEESLNLETSSDIKSNFETSYPLDKTDKNINENVLQLPESLQKQSLLITTPLKKLVISNTIDSQEFADSHDAQTIPEDNVFATKLTSDEVITLSDTRPQLNGDQSSISIETAMTLPSSSKNENYESSSSAIQQKGLDVIEPNLNTTEVKEQSKKKYGILKKTPSTDSNDITSHAPNKVMFGSDEVKVFPPEKSPSDISHSHVSSSDKSSISEAAEDYETSESYGEDSSSSEEVYENNRKISKTAPSPVEALRNRFEGLMDSGSTVVRPHSPFRRMSFNSRKAAIALERIKDSSADKPSYPPKIIKEPPKPAVKRTLKQQLEVERKVRKMVADRICRTYKKAEIVVQLMDMNFEEDEAVQAANECSTLEQAISYLQQECLLCTGYFPVSHIISMVHCSHKACSECIRAYFTVQIRDRNIMELLCPFCNEPDLTDEDIAQFYFNHLDIMLKKLVDEEIHELFQRKLRDRVLMRDPCFRWCSKCSSGFIAMPNLKRLVCPDCNAVTCASCRRPWEKEHQGISCEAFAEWKDATDPEAHNIGLAKWLTEDGIDCPRCHFRYALAKGGCMHFRCIQCQHDFCSGCSRPFKMGQKCGVSEFCGKLGLHAHHPRNCLFYLRDKEPEDLQRLLELSDVKYDKDPPDGMELKSNCQVMEQKETADGMIDDQCGKDVEKGFAGLCRIHYVEYLGQLVNKHKVDPIQIFENDDLELVLRRANIRLPPKKYRETDAQYREKLVNLIQDELPLEKTDGS